MAKFRYIYIAFIALLIVSFSGGGQCLSASELFLCNYCKTHTSEVGCTMMKSAVDRHSSTHSQGDNSHAETTYCYMKFDKSKLFISSEFSISDIVNLTAADHLEAFSVKQIGTKQTPHPSPLIHKSTPLYIFNCSYLI